MSMVSDDEEDQDVKDKQPPAKNKTPAISGGAQPKIAGGKAPVKKEEASFDEDDIDDILSQSEDEGDISIDHEDEEEPMAKAKGMSQVQVDPLHGTL